MKNNENENNEINENENNEPKLFTQEQVNSILAKVRVEERSKNKVNETHETETTKDNNNDDKKFENINLTLEKINKKFDQMDEKEEQNKIKHQNNIDDYLSETFSQSITKENIDEFKEMFKNSNKNIYNVDKETLSKNINNFLNKISSEYKVKKEINKNDNINNIQNQNHINNKNIKNNDDGKVYTHNYGNRKITQSEYNKLSNTFKNFCIKIN